MPALRMGDVEEQRAADRDRDRRTVEMISGARKLVPDQLLEIVARLLDVVERWGLLWREPRDFHGHADQFLAFRIGADDEMKIVVVLAARRIKEGRDANIAFFFVDPVRFRVIL